MDGTTKCDGGNERKINKRKIKESSADISVRASVDLNNMCQPNPLHSCGGWSFAGSLTL